MFDEIEDEQYEIDPPHAFAMLEGQPCSCPSRYYGGDCQHTVSDDEEDRLNAVDPLIEAVKDLEAAVDDYTFGVYVNVTNPDPEDAPVATLKFAVIATSLEVALAMLDADVDPLRSTIPGSKIGTFAVDRIPQALRADCATVEAATIRALRPVLAAYRARFDHEWLRASLKVGDDVTEHDCGKGEWCPEFGAAFAAAR
jgi:hypothetical protein